MVTIAIRDDKATICVSLGLGFAALEDALHGRVDSGGRQAQHLILGEIFELADSHVKDRLALGKQVIHVEVLADDAQREAIM